MHSVRLFFWPLLPILGELLHSAPASCIGTLSALSWLWVSFCIPHSASCILHVSHSCSFGPASAFCILHLHPASGAVHSFGADSAFCILHSACCTYRVNILGWVLHSAFCICILHFQRNTECRISPSMQRLIHADCNLHATRVCFFVACGRVHGAKCLAVLAQESLNLQALRLRKF